MSDYSSLYTAARDIGAGASSVLKGIYNAAVGNDRLLERGIDRGTELEAFSIIYPATLAFISTSMISGSLMDGLMNGLATALIAGTVVPQAHSMYLAGKHDEQQRNKPTVL